MGYGLWNPLSQFLFNHFLSSEFDAKANHVFLNIYPYPGQSWVQTFRGFLSFPAKPMIPEASEMVIKISCCRHFSSFTGLETVWDCTKGHAKGHLCVSRAFFTHFFGTPNTLRCRAWTCRIAMGTLMGLHIFWRVSRSLQKLWVAKQSLPQLEIWHIQRNKKRQSVVDHTPWNSFGFPPTKFYLFSESSSLWPYLSAINLDVCWLQLYPILGDSLLFTMLLRLSILTKTPKRTIAIQTSALRMEHFLSGGWMHQKWIGYAAWYGRWKPAQFGLLICFSSANDGQFGYGRHIQWFMFFIGQWKRASQQTHASKRHHKFSKFYIPTCHGYNSFPHIFLNLKWPPVAVAVPFFVQGTRLPPPGEKSAKTHSPGSHGHPTAILHIFLCCSLWQLITSKSMMWHVT